MPKRVLLLILCAIAAWQIHDRYAHRALEQPDGVLVADVPAQELVDDASTRHIDEFTLRRLATFQLSGRVLLVSRYRFDYGSRLAPYDLGIGWQRMSDSAVLRGLDLVQTGRFLLWHWALAPPIPEDEITRSAANIHVIPGNDYVATQIARLRPGQIVSLRGQLIEATTEKGWLWRSSLSRDDGGAGACELMYVEDIRIRDR